MIIETESDIEKESLTSNNEESDDHEQGNRLIEKLDGLKQYQNNLTLAYISFDDFRKAIRDIDQNKSKDKFQEVI